MNRLFHARRQLRFAHCDPAGIAFYPRYFELCDGVVEDWTEKVIGISRRVLHLDMGLAIPTVALRADFVAVSRLGDQLDFQLDVHKVGRSSIEMNISVSCGNEQRFRVHYHQVLMSMASAKSTPWPDEWHARLLSVVGNEG